MLKQSYYFSSTKIKYSIDSSATNDTIYFFFILNTIATNEPIDKRIIPNDIWEETIHNPHIYSNIAVYLNAETYVFVLVHIYFSVELKLIWIYTHFRWRTFSLYIVFVSLLNISDQIDRHCRRGAMQTRYNEIIIVFDFLFFTMIKRAQQIWNLIGLYVNNE